MKASRSNGYGMDLKFLNYAQSNQVWKKILFLFLPHSLILQVKNPRDSSVSYAAATFVMHWIQVFKKSPPVSSKLLS